MCTERPESLKIARRTLEGLSFCEILEDLSKRTEGWSLHLAITVDTLEKLPKRTEWYVVLPRNYPYGEIEIYPSWINGITDTYPHQAFNAPGKLDCPWLTGNPCLRTSLRTLGRREYDEEPMSIERRLDWHVRRLKEWLESADRGDLLKNGDPFELPQYPHISSTDNFGFVGSRGKIGELEEESWAKYGSAIMHRIVGADQARIWIPIRFKDAKGALISDQANNDFEECEKADIFALWVRVGQVPHVAPWRGLGTYGELREFLTRDTIDLDQVILHFSSKLRDGKQHPLLIGFPIPERVGSEQGSWFWLALLLPVLAHGHVDGFRDNTPCSYLACDKAKKLADNKTVQWLKSRSWHPKDILNRGSFKKDFTDKEVLIIGLGAVGAVVAELLVRAGIKHLVLVDNEQLEIGNLSRHTLTIKELGACKAEAIRRRLNMLEPHVDVESFSCSFYEANKEAHDAIVGSDFIIDCSGDDSLLYDLSKIEFEEEKLFASISLGLEAKQLFVFCAKTNVFPAEQFKNDVSPYLEKEVEARPGYELPHDGIGCWHPAFPARCDDVWLMTAAAVKIVEAFVLGNEQVAGLTVFRQKDVDGVFCGIEKVDSP